MHISKELRQRIAAIRLIIFDVDGVMTDGVLVIGDDGQEYKRFHARDGLGLRMLQDSGVTVAIITGRTSSVVEHRAAELGINHLYQGRRQKLPAYVELCTALSVQPNETAFMGDDVIDLPIMRRAGLALTVSDGHRLVHQYAHWISQACGGSGAVREACELVMHCQGTLDTQMRQYLQPDPESDPKSGP